MQQQAMDDSNRKRPLYPVFECDETADDDVVCDSLDSPAAAAAAAGGGSNQLLHAEKKRRLSVEQVRSLERNFEVENKLEPDRKLQLAKELGLQPRQVAVWFQNRRARWKTKQLEKDYDLLKSEFDELSSSYKDLLRDKEALEQELKRLRSRVNSGAAEEAEQDAVDDGAAKLSIRKISCKKEGSSGCESDASEVVEAESPLAARQVASPPSFVASASAAAGFIADPSSSLLYFPNELQPHSQPQQRPSLLKVEDWSGVDDQSTLPWWDWA